MRFVGEVPHPQFKITIFNWNGKYQIKVEAGMYEQTYKVSEMDFTGGEEDVKKLVNEAFLAKALEVFKLMHGNLQSALGE